MSDSNLLRALEDCLMALDLARPYVQDAFDATEFKGRVDSDLHEIDVAILVGEAAVREA